MAHRKLVQIAVVLLAATSARTALADISIGAEAGAIFTAKRFGFGFAGRLGYDIDLAIIHIIPEVKVAYDRMPLQLQVNELRPMVGVRASLGIAVLAIVGFAHVGYGAPLGAHGQLDTSGLVYEVGGGLDFTTLPLIDLGIWGSFNHIKSPGGYDWVGFGVQVTLTI